MKKKWIKALLLTAVVSLCAVGFSACGKDKEEENSLKNTEVRSEALTVDLENETISGTFSNGTELFKFDKDITVADDAKYYLCMDIYGQLPIPTKIATLKPGDNTYYLVVENGQNVTTYTITLYVKPTYTVYFETNGGSFVESQEVEEGGFATKPKFSTKLGYTFNGWDFDFNTAITENISVCVKWKVNEEMKNFDFSSTANECIITGIKDKKVDRRIVIPDYVTSIEKSAFSGNNNLESVIIGKNVTSIKDSVFCYCENLTSVTWNAINCSSFANNVFEWCTKLTTVVIGDSVQTIPAYAFNSCYSIKNVTIGNHVTSIGSHVFYGCSSLTSITIPESVISIGACAFSGCDKLTSVVFEDTTTWYQTRNQEDWKNKTNGIKFSVDNATQTANYLKTYNYDYFFYKL